MDTGTKSLLFNAVPLLVLAALYLGVGLALVPGLWRDRRRLSVLDVALCSLFPCVAVPAAVFGALHLPNPFLAPVTLVAAAVWCWIYDRHPNLVPLALSHALCTLAIIYCLDPTLTGRLRVGYAYLQLR